MTPLQPLKPSPSVQHPAISVVSHHNYHHHLWVPDECYAPATTPRAVCPDVFCNCDLTERFTVTPGGAETLRPSWCGLKTKKCDEERLLLMCGATACRCRAFRGRWYVGVVRQEALACRRCEF